MQIQNNTQQERVFWVMNIAGFKQKRVFVDKQRRTKRKRVLWKHYTILHFSKVVINTNYLNKRFLKNLCIQTQIRT